MRTPRARLGLIIAGSCLVAAQSLASEATATGATGESRWLRFHADTVLSESRTPPPDSAAWEAIELPDSWRLTDRYLRGTSAWYRFDVGALPPAEPYALYLWRFSMNVEVYFNDELIGGGGRFEEPIARNWNRPFLFPLPRSGWRSGQNHIFVHLRVYPGWGTFTPPALGPLAVLTPAYESRFFWQITMAQYSAVVSLVAMLFGLVFWLTERRDATYLYFACASATWMVYSLNLFVQHIPMPAKAWWWLVHTSVDAFSLFVLLFAHRLMRISRPRLEAAVVAVVLASACLYAVWDLPRLAKYNNVVHSLMLLVPGYLAIWLTRLAVRERSSDAVVFSGCLVLLLALAVHDVFLNSLAMPELWATRFFLVQFGAPAMLIVMLVHLARRLAYAMQETRAANSRLATRVEEVTEALERTYAVRRDLERRQAAAEERDRIYRDLHDDVGARLLSLVYASGDGKPAQLAREALREIRSIVASDRIDGGLLRDIVGDWRAECDGRCEAAGIAVDWDAEVEAGARLTGMQRYQLERILRELVSNAIEHARARRLHVGVDVRDGRLSLIVEDDGIGFERAATSGSGVSGVEHRAGRLGGAARWRPARGGGTRCEVEIALPPNGG